MAQCRESMSGLVRNECRRDSSVLIPGQWPHCSWAPPFVPLVVAQGTHHQPVAPWAGSTCLESGKCSARVHHGARACFVSASHWPSSRGCGLFFLQKEKEQKVCRMLAYYHLLSSSCSERMTNNLRNQDECLPFIYS